MLRSSEGCPSWFDDQAKTATLIQPIALGLGWTIYEKNTFPSCKQNRLQENTISGLSSKFPIKFNVDIFTIVTKTGNFYITFSVNVDSIQQCWWCKVSVIIQQNSIQILFSSQSVSAVKSMILLNISVQETGFIWWH